MRGIDAGRLKIDFLSRTTIPRSEFCLYSGESLDSFKELLFCKTSLVRDFFTEEQEDYLTNMGCIFFDPIYTHECEIQKSSDFCITINRIYRWHDTYTSILSFANNNKLTRGRNGPSIYVTVENAERFINAAMLA